MSVHKIKHSIMVDAVNYAFDHAIPLFCTLELSQRCNFTCRHCYNFDRRKGEEDISISAEQWCSIIDQVVEEGAFYIALTGGEPLLFPHLFTLIDRIRYHHCLPRIKTNGSLLTAKSCKELKEHGVHAIDISLYGASDKSYLQFCGLDIFSTVLSGIDHALDNNIEVTLNILLHKGNFRELGNMISIAQMRGIFFNITNEITDRYDGTGGETLWRLDEQDLEELFNGEYASYFNFHNLEHNVQCSCARTVCGIGHIGDVFPCIGAPIKAGNVVESSFAEIWRRSNQLNKIRMLESKDFKECQNCSIIEFCGRNSGSAYVNTGNYVGCDPYAKIMALLRKRYSS